MAAINATRHTHTHIDILYVINHMKLHACGQRSSLSYGSPSCIIVQLRGIRIMLDCSLDIVMTQTSLPLTESASKRSKNDGDVHHDGLQYETANFDTLDLASIDAILISNHQSITALPYVTEFSRYHGDVYATEPTLAYGRMMMEELAIAHSHTISRQPSSYIPSSSSSSVPLSVSRSDNMMAPAEVHHTIPSSIGSSSLSGVTLATTWPSSSSSSSSSFTSNISSIEHKSITTLSSLKSSSLVSLPQLLSSDVSQASVMISRKRKSDSVINARAIASSSQSESVRRAGHMRVPYDMAAVEACVSRIQPLAYSQVVTCARGDTSITISPVSSGWSIGACNWIIQCDHQKIGYIAASSPSIVRHPQPIDIVSLKNCDVVILTSIATSPYAGIPSISPMDALVKLRTCIETTIRSGGSVLLPSYPVGIVYDLLEYICAHIKRVGLDSVPIYLVSPCASQSMAYSTIVAEWLSRGRQDSAYEARSPFAHTDYIRDGRIITLDNALMPTPNQVAIHSSIANNNRAGAWNNGSPCIVLASHPSLQFGPVLHFLQCWANNERNTLICCEAMWPSSRILTPSLLSSLPHDCCISSSTTSSSLSLKMRVVDCMIDPSLTIIEASNVLKEIKPAHIIVPQSYIDDRKDGTRRGSAIAAAPSSISSLGILRDISCAITSYAPIDVVHIDLPRKFQGGLLSSRLARQLIPLPLGGSNADIAAVRVRALMTSIDNNFELKAIADVDDDAKWVHHTKFNPTNINNNGSANKNSDTNNSSSHTIVDRSHTSHAHGHSNSNGHSNGIMRRLVWGAITSGDILASLERHHILDARIVNASPSSILTLSSMPLLNHTHATAAAPGNTTAVTGAVNGATSITATTVTTTAAAAAIMGVITTSGVATPALGLPSCTIDIPSLAATILVSAGRTIIRTSLNSPRNARSLLRDCLLSRLSTL